MATKWKKVFKMKLKQNLAIKITAFIFSYVMAFLLFLSVVAIIIMGYFKFYFSTLDIAKEEVLTEMAQREARYIENILDEKRELENSYLEKYYKDKNVYYEIAYIEKDTVATNYSGQDYIAYTDREYYTYEDYIIKQDENGTHWGTIEHHTADIKVYIAKNMTKSDVFSVASSLVDSGYRLRYAVIFIALISLALFVFLICFLYASAGHTSDEKIKCNFLDKIPFDVLTAIVTGLAILSAIFIGESSYQDFSVAVTFITLIASIDYFIALIYTMSFATRIKTGTLIKNNVLYYVFKFLGKRLKKLFLWFKYLYSNASLLKKTWIIALGMLALITVFTSLVNNVVHYWAKTEFIILMIFVTAFLLTILFYFAIVLQKIKLGGEQIAKGDLQYKIDTKYMYHDFKDFAESLNNINDGLQEAINEKMKSEHFKTELITNVSHDIKTPLTSIINYVDLIKKEEIKNEKLIEYIDVLDRQSARLKKLVEDLVEASKASSGNLTVNLTTCNITVLLNQALGEFSEKLQKANLTPIIKTDDDGIAVLADGRHLWRVFDNLLSNVCKYSLEGTRIYIDVKTEKDAVYVTFRNISKYQLNISTEELLERFVRGDKSRHTEGHGLGLSIAKSLMELQGGKLDISVDGDLFKATVKIKNI